MNPSYQELFNILVSLFGAAGGWLFANLWRAVRDLQSDDKQIHKDLEAVKILVAGEYIKKVELEGYLSRVFKKLDAIDTAVGENAVNMRGIEERLGSLIKAHDDRMGNNGDR